MYNNVDKKNIEDLRPNPQHLSKKWPKSGDIEAKNISVRYRKTLPLVLKDLNFHINDSEKIGIVGRTGSGKSSLLLALTRIIEADDFENYEENYIKIDGENIYNMNTRSMRKAITVIPQNPLLLKGDLRKNLDPFD